MNITLEQVADYLADLPQSYEDAAGPDEWRQKFVDYLNKQHGAVDPLVTWYELRLQSSRIAGEIKVIQDDATQEALAQVSDQEKKTFDIGSAGHKVQVRFTAKKIKPDDDLELSNLHAEIELEKETARTTNADRIAQIEADLMSLTKALGDLKMTDRGRDLEQKYSERLDQLAEMVPVLALKGV